MRTADCSSCEKRTIPLNDTIKVDNQVYCENCFEKNFTDESHLKNKKIEREIDPTVCSSCSKDFGDQELNKISAYPICKDCEIKIKNKTFPLWVKSFFIAIIVIVLVSFVWNWKFYSAYTEIKESGVYLQNGDYTNAAALMQSASEKVPEVEDLSMLASYYRGIEYLTKDRGADALVEFERCKDRVPADYNIDNLIIQAKIGATFDAKDYDGFLAASLENLALDTTLAMSQASVASAYACLYAERGKEEDKQFSVLYLEKAKQIDSLNEELKQYYNRIDHRLYSRTILKHEEFLKQFPNGWSK